MILLFTTRMKRAGEMSTRLDNDADALMRRLMEYNARKRRTERLAQLAQENEEDEAEVRYCTEQISFLLQKEEETRARSTEILTVAVADENAANPANFLSQHYDLGAVGLEEDEKVILPPAANHLASSSEYGPKAAQSATATIPEMETNPGEEEYIVDMAIPDADDPLFSGFGYEPEWSLPTAHEAAQAMEWGVEVSSPSKSELAQGLEPELPAKAPDELDGLLADLLPEVDSPLASSKSAWPLPNVVVPGTVAAGTELEELAQGLEPELSVKEPDEFDQLDAELEGN